MVRAYRSAQRERSAAFTRTSILRAAETLFTSRGYADTTVADIAKQAEVAVTTVYGSVGNKSEIVLALISDGTNDPLIERTALNVRASDTPETAVAALAAGVCETIQKVLPLVGVMYDTAPTDAAIAAAVVTTEAAYRDNLAPLAHHLGDNRWLKDGLSHEDAVDILWFYFGVPALRILHDSGWPWDKVERWLTEQAAQALVA